MREPRLLLAGAAFFLSGAAALAYQVSWQRILALQTGVGLYSVAVIVAAFMFGLGVGSHAGGVWSTRVSPRLALALFAACELGIAAFGAVSVSLYYDRLYVERGWLYADPVRGAVLHFVQLAVPTLLMGMSLPFLTRALVRDASGASNTISFLYGINMLGAAVGALATPWVFVRHHGLRSAVAAAVIANLVAGAAALLLLIATRVRMASSAGTAWTAPTTFESPEAPRSFRTWLALYALAGFCALSLEVLWFRLLDIAVKSTAYTFGTLLAVYLLGSAAGSLAGLAVVHHIRRPLRWFLAIECLLLAYAAATVVLLVVVPADTPGYSWFVELWGGRRSFNLGGALHLDAVIRLYVVLPLVLFGPPTFLMGLAYPILQRAVQDDPATSGRKVGFLHAANIAGCVAGSLAVGLVALDYLGTSGTLRALTLVGLVFAAVAWSEPANRRLFGAIALALLVLAAALPTRRELWMRLHGTSDAETLVAEDATGVAALVRDEERWRLWAGGRNHSVLPFGGLHTILGAAPAVVHPAPVDVAIIGLGSGDTAASAGLRRDVDQRLTVFEIFRSERDLLTRLAARSDAPPRLGRLLRDERVGLRIEDGRSALGRESARYDIIEADALWPTSPYAGNLYSLEFFRLCASRLKPGGLVCTWAPTRRVRATFGRALPHVMALADGQVLIGSATPIPPALEAWRQRLYSNAAVIHLGPDRVSEVWEALRRAEPLSPSGSERDVNHDLFPRDEYNSPD